MKVSSSQKKHSSILLGLLILLVLTTMLTAVEGFSGNKHQYRQSGHATEDRRGGRNSVNSDNNRNCNANHDATNNRGNSRQASMLSRAFRIMHDQGGTIAVLEGCRDTLLDYQASVLVEAALLAGNPKDGKKGFRNRGISSGILNALLGCCCCCSGGGSYDNDNNDDESTSRATMAIELMRAYDAIGKQQNQQQNQQLNAFTPDLVALCLAYVATSGVSTATSIVDGERRTTGGKIHDETPIATEFLRRAEEIHCHCPSSVSAPLVQSRITNNNNNNRDTQTKSRNANSNDPNWSSKLEKRCGIKVLHEAEEFVVLSKPSGMVCYHGGGASTRNNNNNINKADPNKGQRTRNAERKRRKRKQQKAAGESGGTGNNNNNDDDESLEECLLAQGLSLSTLNKEGKGLVHRIDRGTSGCLVVAKTNRMHAILLAHFFLRTPKKSYRALVCSSNEQLTNHQSSSSHNGGEISCAIDGRPARSRYSLETSVGKYLSRIKVETLQGRRHQVRIHCSEGLGAPILLDPLYGGQSILSTLLRGTRNNENSNNENNNSKIENSKSLLTRARAAQQFCLHASTLRIDSLGIDAEAPLPDWWQELEEELG